MLEVLIGFISGIISGTGMGGGTILILLLSIIMGLDQHVSQATNLVFFVPTAIAAIFISLRKKNIDVKLGNYYCNCRCSRSYYRCNYFKQNEC